CPRRDRVPAPDPAHPAGQHRRQLPHPQRRRPALVADLARHAGHRPAVETLMSRILFVTSRIPYPPREGHQLRSWHLLRAAAARHHVDLLSLQRQDDPVAPAPEMTAPLASFHAVPLPGLGNAPAAVATAGRWLRERQPLLVARYLSAEIRESF